jgi:hypothetical protein
MNRTAASRRQLCWCPGRDASALRRARAEHLISTALAVCDASTPDDVALVVTLCERALPNVAKEACVGGGTFWVAVSSLRHPRPA